MKVCLSPLVGTLLLPLLLTACASLDRGETMGRIRAAVDEGVTEPSAATAPPPEVSAALMPEFRVELPGISVGADEQRFDVAVRGATAAEFFMSLVEGTLYNVILHPEVGGRLDLSLKNVTVPEVMAIVRDTYGYDFERTGTVYRIYPNTIRTQLFEVDYLDMRRSGSSRIHATPGDVSRAGQGEGEPRGDSTGSRGSGSIVDTESQTDFWLQLRQDVSNIIGQGEGRQVTVNPMAGIIAVRARPDELRQVARYLGAITKAVQRQVILEARIVEVALSDAHQIGINWAAIANHHGELAVLGPSGFQGGELISTGGAALNGGSASSQVTNAFQTSVNENLTFGLFGRDFAAFIDLLRTQGDVQVLSSPRVSTVNNQRAVIKVGADEFFVTDVESNTTTGTATTQNVSVELTPFFSGVALDVTPQISAGGEVILHIHPTVSNVSEQTKTINTSVGNLVLPLAASTIRESDSVIRAGNGQIVVIGGLMQNSLRTERNKIPLLGDLPLLGTLFSHTGETARKTELVILLKPTVVEGAQQWSDQLRRSRHAVDAMDRFGAPALP